LAVGVGAGVDLCALTQRPESRFCTQRIAWTAKYADSTAQVRSYQPYASAAALWLIYAGDALSTIATGPFMDLVLRGSVQYRRAGKRSLERWLKIRDSLSSLVVWFGRLWIAWISCSREAGEFMRKRLMKMVRKKRKISDRRYLYDQCRASK